MNLKKLRRILTNTVKVKRKVIVQYVIENTTQIKYINIMRFLRAKNTK